MVRMSLGFRIEVSDAGEGRADADRGERIAFDGFCYYGGVGWGH